MKASYKWSKAILVLRVKNFDPTSIVPKLGKFLFFDNFFPDLDDF